MGVRGRCTISYSTHHDRPLSETRPRRDGRSQPVRYLHGALRPRGARGCRRLAGLLYLALELGSAAAVAGYVLLMRRRSRVGDFWISARAERLIPRPVPAHRFRGLLLAVLSLFDAPRDLFLMTLSMGFASAVAVITLFWKASAHCTVEARRAAGLLLLGPLGLVFLLVLPLMIWSRIVTGAHTLPQTLVGAAVRGRGSPSSSWL